MSTTNGLHTEADDREPLTPREAAAMGRQDARPVGPGVSPADMVVYGDVENSPETQDQYDAPHAEPDEHF